MFYIFVVGIYLGICYVVNKIMLPSKFNFKLQIFSEGAGGGGPEICGQGGDPPCGHVW
jgi:hypothetical protein